MRNTLKEKKVYLAGESDLLNALSAYVDHVGFPSGSWSLIRDEAANIIRLKIDGYGSCRLVLKLKVRFEARDLAKLADHTELNSCMLVTVDLTDALAKRCHEKGLSALGLNGRLILRLPGVFVDMMLPKSLVRYKAAIVSRDPFSGKSTRLVRVLLSHQGQNWKMSNLSKATGLSLSRVSNLMNELKASGWVSGQRGDWQVSDREGLLDKWKDQDNWRSRGMLIQYASLDPNPEKMAEKLMKSTSCELAFTQWFAANLRYPYTQSGICSAYCARTLNKEELALADFHEVATGGSLWLIIPREQGVFQCKQKVRGFPLVSDVQIYLDLLQVGLRGPDQAEVLRNWEGFGR